MPDVTRALMVSALGASVAWALTLGPASAEATKEAGPECPPCPCASASPAPATASPAATTGIGEGGEVSLLAMPTADDEGVFTLGDSVPVEYVTRLEVETATRGWAAEGRTPDSGMAFWTFLVRFTRPGASPGPYGLGSGFYSVLGFSLHDDQGFEYGVLDAPYARQPIVRYGELGPDGETRGWLTFHAPANARWVELRYTPISGSTVYFRLAAP
jgi:hypothetical protein